MAAPLSAAEPVGREVQAALGYGEDTHLRLAAYVDLLRKWQRAINLVGPGTMDELWRRHILDCGQLFALLPDPRAEIADLGAGAGLPGAVLAIMGAGRVTLIESDRRKAAFLAEVNRTLSLGMTVETRRVEEIQHLSFDLITARALAPLARLLAYAQPLLKTGGQCLFLKGAAGERELTEAEETWKMTVERFPSLSDPSGVVFQLKDIHPRHG